MIVKMHIFREFLPDHEDFVLGIRRSGANRPWCTMPGIFVGYNFLKAHPIPFKMTLVSTLTVGAFGRSSLLNALRT